MRSLKHRLRVQPGCGTMDSFAGICRRILSGLLGIYTHCILWPWWFSCFFEYLGPHSRLWSTVCRKCACTFASSLPGEFNTLWRCAQSQFASLNFKAGSCLMNNQWRACEISQHVLELWPYVSYAISVPFRWSVWKLHDIIHRTQSICDSLHWILEGTMYELGKVCGLSSVRWFGMQSEHDRINNLLRRAIREGEEAGAKVIGLGALNKAEFLNAGGSIFVEEMPDIKPRIVHGNTLTTAVVLRTLPAELPEVWWMAGVNNGFFFRIDSHFLCKLGSKLVSCGSWKHTLWCLCFSGGTAKCVSAWGLTGCTTQDCSIVKLAPSGFTVPALIQKYMGCRCFSLGPQARLARLWLCIWLLRGWRWKCWLRQRSALRPCCLMRSQSIRVIWSIALH